MTSSPRRVRRWLLTALALVIAILVFKLFEPVLVWTYGWRALPGGNYPSVSVPSDGWQELAARAHDLLRDAQAQLSAPALSAAVSIDGKRVWAGAIGYADVDRAIPATLSTVFRLGSTSKAVTSVAMGTLIGRKVVDLDAPVSKYLPDLSQPMASITTRQAMSHTAGVRNYALCFCFPAWESLNRTHFASRQRDVLRSYERDALLFAPGRGFSYTSLGYNVAGAIIESVSGVSFSEFLERQVFAPLHMDASRVDTGQVRDNDAVFYDVEDGQYKEAFRVDNTNKQPSGGIMSTPSDVARLGAEMLEPTLFDATTRDLLMRPQPLGDGRANQQGYALGWRFQSESKFLGGATTTPRLHHHGTAQGSTSYLMIFPDYRMVVSVMMNKGVTDAGPLVQQAERLAELFARRQE